MTWLLFDYGGVICYPQPEEDLALLARAAGCTVPEFGGAYWPYRLDYDRAVLDVTSFWEHVAGHLGRSFGEAQMAELARLDVASWMHLQAGTVALIEDLASGSRCCPTRRPMSPRRSAGSRSRRISST